MNAKVSFKEKWHAAGIAGLVLASISIAYLLAEYGLSQFKSGWATAVTLVLQVVKIVACIKILHLFLKKFKADYPNALVRDVRQSGTLAAFLSAAVFAGVSMVFYTYHPEITTQVFEVAKSVYGNLLDANSRTALEAMEANFPRLIFGYTLVYCFVIGWILSAIMAPSVCSNAAMEEDDEEEEE